MMPICCNNFEHAISAVCFILMLVRKFLAFYQSDVFLYFRHLIIFNHRPSRFIFMYVYFSCFLRKVLFRSLFWVDLSAMSVYTKKPAFYSILAEIPSYACNARVSTKTHDMYAIHALQQNMDPWALPQCLFKGISIKKIKLVFQNSYKKYWFLFSDRNLNMKFKILNWNLSVKDFKRVLSH